MVVYKAKKASQWNFRVIQPSKGQGLKFHPKCSGYDFKHRPNSTISTFSYLPEAIHDIYIIYI